MPVVPLEANVEAVLTEFQLIGCVLFEPAVWSQVETLAEGDFREPVNAYIWEALRLLHSEGLAESSGAAASTILAIPGVDALGGRDWLINLIDQAPPSSAAVGLAAMVEADAARRRIQQLIRPGATPGEIRKGLEEEIERPEAFSQSRKLRATPAQLLPPHEIPRREWIYGRHLIRRYVSCTVAPGGLGKSSLVLAECIAMTLGRPVLGEWPDGKLRVWYWNGEDDTTETERRVAALCLLHRVDPREVSERLFIDSGRSMPICLARENRDGFRVDSATEKHLLAEMRARSIDVLVLDPFVAVHEIGENDNTRINAVVRSLARIADRANAAIEVVHHVRKGGAGASGDTKVEDARGAGALLGAVRSARVLNVMSEEEAQKRGIENRYEHFRVDNGKSNMAPRSDLATWRRIVSVDLGNNHGHRYGDSVGAVEAWSLPGPFTGFSVRHTMEMQRIVAEGEWRADPQSDQWVGRAAAQAMGLDVDGADKPRIKEMVRAWLDNEVLKVVERPDSKRMKRKYVEVGEWQTDGDL